MVLIFSNSNDSSTNDVIDWLIYYGVQYIRVNGSDTFELSSFELSSSSFECKIINTKTKTIIDFSKILVTWYRRGDLVFKDDTSHLSEFSEILEFMESEYKILHDFLLSYLEALPKVDSWFRGSVNKLIVLSEAKRVGLPIPYTYIFRGTLPDLEGNFITKSISEVFRYDAKDGSIFSNPTQLLNIKDKSLREVKYSLSQIQVHIEKECDIRVFYLNGASYAMAIMSQSNPKSKIDFRYYPTDFPNRRFPLELPESVSHRIERLMCNLQLDSGSIDLILQKDGTFVFLEVNPVGQFGMTSVPCNYMLERLIALHLSNLVH